MSRRYEESDQDRPPRPDGVSGAESMEMRQKERGKTLRDRYGGFDWVATFLGFAVAIFFLTVLLGIVGAIVGSVGYQIGAEVPRVGSSVSGATQQLGIGALAGSIVGLLLAYFIGGYTAGRLARYDGVLNGIGVVAWTILMAIILGVLGAILGTKFNVASQLHLTINASSLTIGGLISLAATLIVMLVASGLGGGLGGRYHTRIDRDSGVRT
jgi:hypothetical protein